VIFLPVDWSGGHLTPAGVRGRGDPTGAISAEEAPRNARGKQVPRAEINRQIKQSLQIKQLYLA
jgi:hypothetical protein